MWTFKPETFQLPSFQAIPDVFCEEFVTLGQGMARVGVQMLRKERQEGIRNIHFLKTAFGFYQ